MTCSDLDKLRSLAPDELAPDERRRVAAHLASCSICRATDEEHRAIDSLLAASAARIPVRGAEQTATALRAPRTRMLVRLAWWSMDVSRTMRAAAPPVIGVSLLLLSFWVVGRVRPHASRSGTPGSSLEQPIGSWAEPHARVWLLRTTPKADSALQGAVPFEVHVGYQLYGARSALLSVRVVDVPSGQMRYFSPPQLISANDNRAVVSFVLDGERARTMFGAGHVQLEAVLRDAAPGITRPVLADETFSTTRYVIP